VSEDGGVMLKIFILVASLIAPQAFAKVGFVDVQEAIKATTAGKKAKTSLDAEYEKRKKDLDKKKADIEKIGQDLEKKKAVLSEEVLGKRQMELQEEMMKFQKTVAENQRDIQEKEKELVEPIIKKLRSVIDKVAAEQDFEMVIEKQGNNVLFAKKDADLTDLVVKKFESEK
jgi:outer membrane protein